MSPVSAGPCLVVVVAGEADWVTADRLRDELVAAFGYGPQSVVLDLAELEFCDVHGVRALLQAVDVAERPGVTVTLRGMSLQLSWLYSTFRTYRSTGGQQSRLLASVSAPHSWSEAVGRMSPA
ncbi:STAS domain-containing protein [Blastococcus sp. CT_GayMR16]|uniref:STAS domain-containing protein n=1 Tax=Blastococcus sp. CT_GayMR16 TaxID=2559607 RepID=UPI001431AFEA|nr:STAS domain-containing protein [Blastococcus sp. CT_GayMR16]